MRIEICDICCKNKVKVRIPSDPKNICQSCIHEIGRYSLAPLLIISCFVKELRKHDVDVAKLITNIKVFQRHGIFKDLQ